MMVQGDRSGLVFSILLVLLLCAVACTSYQRIPMARVQEQLAPGDRVRVTTLDGDRAEFEIVTVTAELIAGESRQFRLVDVAEVESRQFDFFRSFGLYIVIGTILLWSGSISLYDFGTL